MFHVSKKQALFVKELCRGLVSESVISEEVAKSIEAHIVEDSFDWRRITRYAIWAAVVSLIIASLTLLSTSVVIDLITSIFKQPDIGFAVVFSCLAAVSFFVGYRRSQQHPSKRVTNEGVMFLGCVFLSFALNSVGVSMQWGTEGELNLLLFSCVLFATLGYLLKSPLIFCYALILAGGYFGAETGYVSGFGAYWLGINYPLRFFFFGVSLVLIALALRDFNSFRPLYAVTKNIGLLYGFVSLWVLSIFGNYGDMDVWSDAGRFELLHWSLIFLAGSIAAIYLGVKLDDSGFRGFGLTFLFINLYTRYFEHFWDKMPLALFFALLGASFWLLGAYAERIWVKSGSFFSKK
ncbi:DUF2157 domain-containing protein [Estrella lausannensis]|uniref:Integral membrane protein n=1 Tax=Estrella lausannensis TaxID=483423 RepID=A0A0H5E5U4_9BACT|nr:DUF2157 domain-containing protein [Estrella lausannensis]CRX38590.1 integral membrane protein [Estrella lausannensis]